jgi:hypothetical protein
MARPLIITTILGFGTIFTVTSADASAYCARFVGGKERITSSVHAIATSRR